MLEELARSDYGGLTFERVAARAGVNKTTVYRHWDTKADLVRAALSSVAEVLDTSGCEGMCSSTADVHVFVFRGGEYREDPKRFARGTSRPCGPPP